MSYPTYAYPEWSTVDPKIRKKEVPEFVETAANGVRDLFDQYHDIHRPERDALVYSKSSAVYMALAITEYADEFTVGEVAAIDAEEVREMAEERGVADDELSPQDVAYAVYANRVAGHSWGEDRTDLEPGAFIFLHDGMRELEQAGREVWEREYDD